MCLDTYDDFIDHVNQITNVEKTTDLLSWDQQVMMPPEGTPARSKQKSTLSSLKHGLLTDDNLAAYLDDCDKSSLDPQQQAVVREIRREHERADRVSTDLVEEISETTSDALPVWEAAKAESEFEEFAPILERLVELKREYAAQINPDRDPYAVLFEDYEPYIDLETAERILERLREELVPLIDEIGERGAELPRPFEGTYDEDAQEALNREILDRLGYDWDRGRLDRSSHPFTLGTQFDCRITTRFDEDDPLSAMGSTIHEFGHATYNLGLPKSEYGTPLGESRDLVVHESQSRLWENHVGRSISFWELIWPDIETHLGLDGEPQVGYEAANRIYPDNLIRVEADELTYHMHIILRFEIERDLIRGDLEVDEIPAVWNDKMDQYLGVRPDTDAEGCLQDIHWSHGYFGYFPTYSIGSVLSAQIYASAEDQIDDLEAKIRRGEFDPLRDWLTESVYRHGQRYTTPDLIQEATGEELTADYFIDYATEKFSELYEL